MAGRFSLFQSDSVPIFVFWLKPLTWSALLISFFAYRPVVSSADQFLFSVMVAGSKWMNDFVVSSADLFRIIYHSQDVSPAKSEVGSGEVSDAEGSIGGVIYCGKRYRRSNIWWEAI